MNVTRTIALAAAIAGIVPAAPRYIGVATAAGTFWIDHTGVRDNATVFEGSAVETETEAARLRLTNGVEVVLEAGSRAQVFADHLTLEKGRGQLTGAGGYQIEARSLRISTASPGSRVVVGILDAARIDVQALEGTARVMTAAGVVVANVETGRVVELRLEGSQDASILTGCVSRVGTAYMMRDETSAVTVELRGPETSDAVGKRVEVTGAVMPSVHAVKPAEQVIRVSAVKVLGTGCGTTIAASGDASSRSRATSASNPTGGATVSAGGHTALIAGVAVAAGAGAAAGIATAQRQKKPPVSHPGH